MFTLRKLISLALVFVNASPGLALPSHSLKDEPFVEHEKRDTSRPWNKLHRVNPAFPLRVRIALTQTNLDKGHDWLMDISHPESPNYGKHYSAEEVASLFSPADETINSVRDWLVSSGIDEKRITHTDNRGWLVFDAWVEEAENLFRTEYHHFRHERGRHGIAGDTYSIPKRLQKHINFVTPGVLLTPSWKEFGHGEKADAPSHHIKPRQHPTAPLGSEIPDDPLADCYHVLTPDCIMRLYNIPLPTYEHPNPNNSMGIYTWFGSYDQHDLDMFWTNFAPRIPNGTKPIAHPVDGAQTVTNKYESGPASIAEEDVLSPQMALSIIYPQNVTLFATDSNWVVNAVYNGGHDNWHGFINHFLDAIDGTYCTYCAYGQCGDSPHFDSPVPNPGYQHKLDCGVYNPPNVVGIPYALEENDLPDSYQRRQCSEFMKLALRGTTVLFVAGNGECSLSEPYHFVPIWPHGCPYITSIGGTHLNPEAGGISLPEEVIFFSSGGFSNLYPRPDYQKANVDAYFANYDPGFPYYETTNGTRPPWHEGYNRIGRAYPDISGVCDNYPYYEDSFHHNDSYRFGSGISGTTPVIAAIFNRINEERLAVGKSTVGFVNPALYHNPQMLNDVVSGHMLTFLGCLNWTTNVYHPKIILGGGELKTFGIAFKGEPGWDPGSGNGTPNYPLMLDYFMSLP